MLPDKFSTQISTITKRLNWKSAKFWTVQFKFTVFCVGVGQSSALRPIGSVICIFGANFMRWQGFLCALQNKFLLWLRPLTATTFTKVTPSDAVDRRTFDFGLETKVRLLLWPRWNSEPCDLVMWWIAKITIKNVYFSINSMWLTVNKIWKNVSCEFAIETFSENYWQLMVWLQLAAAQCDTGHHHQRINVRGRDQPVWQHAKQLQLLLLFHERHLRLRLVAVVVVHVVWRDCKRRKEGIQR